MIGRIEGLPRGLFGFEAGGRATRDEVDEVVNAFDATVAESYDVALLVEFLPDLESDAAFAETRFENRLSARGRTQRLVFVGQRRWRDIFDDSARFVGCEARMFATGQPDLALAWLLESPFLSGHEDKTTPSHPPSAPRWRPPSSEAIVPIEARLTMH